MTEIDPRLFEYSLDKIDQGYIFEDFACRFLAQVLGYAFTPAGGIKDRGIDGLERFSEIWFRYKHLPDID